METGEAGREEVGQAVAVDRWLQTEVGEASDLRLADGQLVDAGFLGEGGDDLLARMLKNILPNGSAGSYSVPPSESLTPRAVRSCLSRLHLA
ncbi:hypothetical protein ACFVTY_07095 [Streptomyces sp. NPDC058067]|uniref:hypothetical protein n=1 Tax=Streptomyces sp. NPDC058067 TaxID=3346324 RepID=UPI0036EE929D